MANLSSNFNSKKPGILNISTNNTPLSIGFPISGSSVFVEDGNGVKSGLKLGVELVESIEPTTKNGVCNVSFCDRTYASISDVKLLSSALEIYRDEITSNLTEVLTPVTDAISDIETNLDNAETLLTSIDDFATSLQDLSIGVRLSSLEENALSKNGSTVVGILSFSSTGIINMNSSAITNLGEPVAPNDAVRKSYVDDAVSDLQTQIGTTPQDFIDLEQRVGELETKVQTLETDLESALENISILLAEVFD